MARTTHELAFPLQTSLPYQREDVTNDSTPIHEGSSIESDFEPEFSSPEDLTSRTPRPYVASSFGLDLVIFKSRSAATRGLFWDGAPNFQPRSGDEDDA
ncbi:hypothetical protein AVEN_166271-1 [Araneus ventricosus]|uniref:Uncharacterized protein n=1 Tax=Araneus ventricosus TaxID=182803 RepID=A0A4Y2M876_ARAVE|nr:hypothetical protein AVEN_166271-1 [Araneus ventricosus]